MTASQQVDFFRVGRGDLLPSLSVKATTKINGAVVPVPDIAGADVVFIMTRQSDDVKIIDRAPAYLENATTGLLRYDWQTGDTDEAGDFWAEFELTKDGKPLTVPNSEKDQKIFVRITEDLG
jgi:hypothetical protein